MLTHTWGRDQSIKLQVLFLSTNTGPVMSTEENVSLLCKPLNTVFAVRFTPLIKLCFSLPCFGETRIPLYVMGQDIHQN